MGNVAALWRWAQAHPRLVDSGVAVAVFIAALPDVSPHDRHVVVEPDVTTLLLLALGAAVLVFRRSHPVLVWGLALLAGVLAVLHSGEGPGLALPTCVALYTLGTRFPVRSTVVATLVTTGVYAVAVAVVQGSWLDERGDSPALFLLAVSGAAAAVGVAVRSQRAALEAAEARARQAELTREEEAERRVTDERVRIARELHDIVAHHISVINVQAGVARHLLDSDPEQARTALGLVRDASRTVLSEMGSVVGLLRTREEDAPTEPSPGLATLGALVESLRRAGLRLRWESTGRPEDLPPIQDLTAYRVVQESLTNAVKYGAGSADLVVHHSPEEVVIEVRNPVRADGAAATGGGHGLIGMRERVEAVHGHLVAGACADGTFAVRATVPRGRA